MQIEPTRRSVCWGLLRQRECWRPTARGWLALCLLLPLLAYAGLRTAHPFLSVTDPLPGGLLVVEGWAPDKVIAAAWTEFKQGRYEKIYVTGGPLEQGAFLSEYESYARLGAATLVKLGAATNQVEAVPARAVVQDRTYASAVALRNWLLESGRSPDKLQLITTGPHARRSRLMYEKAFGNGTRVGVTAMPVDGYDPRHWWRSSAGVRNVLSEVFGYLYARFLFWP